jgi:hypothetical protein
MFGHGFEEVRQIPGHPIGKADTKYGLQSCGGDDPRYRPTAARDGDLLALLGGGHKFG